MLGTWKGTWSSRLSPEHSTVFSLKVSAPVQGAELENFCRSSSVHSMGVWTHLEWLSEAQEAMVKDSWVGKPRVELQSSSKMELSGLISFTGNSGLVSWPGGTGKRESSSTAFSASYCNEPPATQSRKPLSHPHKVRVSSQQGISSWAQTMGGWGDLGARLPLSSWRTRASRSRWEWHVSETCFPWGITLSLLDAGLGKTNFFS